MEIGTTRESPVFGEEHRDPRPEGGGKQVDDAVKFLMFLIAAYGAYKNTRTALRLGGELFG